MKIQDLIIGAYIFSNQLNQVVEVASLGNRPSIADEKGEGMVGFNIGNTHYWHSVSNFSPIELNDEWLQKLGLKKFPGHKKLWVNEVFALKSYQSSYCLYDYVEGSKFRASVISVRIKHVHQLQQLYSYITGNILQ